MNLHKMKNNLLIKNINKNKDFYLKFKKLINNRFKLFNKKKQDFR